MERHSNLLSQGDAEPSVLIGWMLVKLQYAVFIAMSRARQRLVQLSIVFSFVFLILWIAAFLYGTFYYSYMPQATFSAPVNYYYRTDCESPASFLCSYPMANISLIRNKKHVLTFGQPYRMSLQLEMPDSPTNRELGMFMIKTTCFSQDGEQVASSARSSILRYRSDLLRTLGTLLFLPAFLTGAAEQKQVLEVELFSDFTDNPYAPSVTAVIEIMSSRVQIYSSDLYIHAHFTGIRYLLYNFPVISAIVGVSSNFTFLGFIFIFSYMRLLFQAKPQRFRMSWTEENNQQGEERAVPAGTAEMLGPFHQNPTDERQEEPHSHVGNGTEQQDRDTIGQGEINETEAA
ncbi:seipin-like isoform X2 [Neolamprologus brichardi]|uniref:seipin-like isoform X2 n=1 Tax=Neolamprologus brichardi TaxID=32507 RepID=UPI0003EC5AA9|nr:seipin-like isoform X2 [Neolamprologus brichardi]